MDLASDALQALTGVSADAVSRAAPIMQEFVDTVQRVRGAVSKQIEACPRPCDFDKTQAYTAYAKLHVAADAVGLIREDLRSMRHFLDDKQL